jgi:hypothetical protein
VDLLGRHRLRDRLLAELERDRRRKRPSIGRSPTRCSRTRPVAKGFKGGGFDDTPANVAQATTPFDPETATNYEIGVKTDFSTTACA